MTPFFSPRPIVKMSLCLSAPHHCQCAFRGIVNFLGLLDFRYRRHEGGGGLVGLGLYSNRAQSTEQGEEGEEGCNLVSTSVSAGVCVCVFWHYRVFFG